MSYYQLHKDERLEYQKLYNQNDKYKSYQKEYYQKNKDNILNNRKDYNKDYYKDYYIKHKKEKPYKPLPKYKLYEIERVIKQKLKDYHKTLEQEAVAKDLVDYITYDKNVKPFDGFIVKNNMFVLKFD